MNDIPKESPKKPDQNRFASQPSYWDPLAWAVIGFAIGTLAAAPFILSRDLRSKLQGGAVYGGSLGTLIGLVHGAKRRRMSRQYRVTSESEHDKPCPMCGSTTIPTAPRCLSCGEDIACRQDLTEPPAGLAAVTIRIPSAVGFAIILGMLIIVVLIFRLRH